MMGGSWVYWLSLWAALVGPKYCSTTPPVVTVSSEGPPDVPDLTILVYNRGANCFCPAMKGSGLPPPLVPKVDLGIGTHLIRSQSNPVNRDLGTIPQVKNLLLNKHPTCITHLADYPANSYHGQCLVSSQL